MDLGVSEEYPFDPRFEQSVVALLVTSDRFWNRLGPFLEAERFKHKLAKLLVYEANEVFESAGKPPGSLSAVLQRLCARHDAGKLAMATIDLCVEYVLEADKVDPTVAVDSATAVIKRIKNQETLDSAFTVHAERGSMSDIAAKFQSIENIGVVDMSLGCDMESLGEDIDKAGTIARLPTGFRGLDSGMGGGIPRGEFWFYLAGDKIGKSMQLTQTASIGCELGMFVACVTLELEVNKWRARVMATATGVPSQDIIEHGSKSIALETWGLRRKEADLFSRNTFRIQKFPGHQTPPSAVFDWVSRIEERETRAVDVLVIDYADKLTGKASDSDYIQMRDVYESLRQYAEDNHKWVISASQAQRIELGVMPSKIHCADSQHKSRVADGMIGLTRYEDEDNQVAAKVVISRNVGDGYSDGPTPNGFAYGCFVRNAAKGVTVEEALKAEADLGVLG